MTTSSTTSSIVQPRTSAENTTGRWRQVTAWSGIAFTPLFVVGFLFANRTPAATASDAKWISWYSSSGHRAGLMAGVFLLVFAGLSFLAFVAGTQQWVRRAEEQSPVAYRLLTFAGPVAAVLFMIGGIAGGGIAGNISAGGTPVPHDADLLRQSLVVPLVAVGGGLAASLFIAAVTTAARRVGAFPTGLVWLGWVAAVVLLFGAVFVPLVALPIWVLVTSVVRLRRADTG